MQNFGYCGQRGRNIRDATNNPNVHARNYQMFEIRLGMVGKDVKVMGRGGWKSSAELTSSAQAASDLLDVCTRHDVDDVTPMCTAERPAAACQTKIR